MNLQTIYRKLFLSKYYFTIALRRREEGVGKNKHFSPLYVMPADKDHWSADPMLVDHEGKTYLFYEAVEYDRGHIAVAEVADDGSIGEPTVVLKDTCHYSYPFVFRDGDTWYMIPESSEAREVRLYRATEFPEKWELHSVLLRERAVDTTVFEQNGNWYLLTFLTDGLSERVIPRAYRMRFEEEKVVLDPLSWDHYDTLRVRGAGPVCRDGEVLLRPAQISQEQRYGDAIAFYRVQAEEEYTESLAFEMRAEDLSVCGIYVDGLHTYCASSQFEAIDLRCREFDLWKPVKKLMCMLKK